MAVDRISAGRFEKNKVQARKTALTQVEWAIEWNGKLSRIKNGQKYVDLAKSIKDKLDRNEELHEWEYQDADTCYEMTMKALGLPFVPKHHDRRTGNLRHPK